MASPRRFINFFRDLKQRKVLRVAAGYVIIGWVVLQAGDVFVEGLSLPQWVFPLLLVLLVLGFPIALLLSWALEWDASGIRRDPRDSEPAQHCASIAVLPFDDLSEGHDQDYFCEGIAQEILNVLCRIDGLSVASRVLSFEFDAGSADPEDVGRKLNVETVLSGSVRKSGDLLRINAQLVRTSDGFHLWSQQFDRRLEDIFEIQGEIAKAIAHTLRLTLARHAGGTELHTDPIAYDFFLRGLAHFYQQGEKDNLRARDMFRRAMEMDPDFARAWAGLAYTYALEYLYFERRTELIEMARRTSAKALALSPELVESHIARALAHMINREYAHAESEFERAIDLDPNNFEAWYFYARCKVHEGDHGRAIELFEQAARARPDDYQSLLLPVQSYMSLGDRKGAMRRLEEALEKIRTVLEIRPDDTRARNLGAFALLRLGRAEEAIDWMEQSLKAAPEDPIVTYNAACLYALADRPDLALKYLQTCAGTGGLNYEWLQNDSDLDPLRGRAEFKAILAMLEQPEAPVTERRPSSR